MYWAYINARCDMAGLWQINFILANAARKMSNLILNQYPFL